MLDLQDGYGRQGPHGVGAHGLVGILHGILKVVHHVLFVRRVADHRRGDGALFGLGTVAEDPAQQFQVGSGIGGKLLLEGARSGIGHQGVALCQVLGGVALAGRALDRIEELAIVFDQVGREDRVAGRRSSAGRDAARRAPRCPRRE